MTVTNKTKPVVDEAELDRLAAEEEAKVDEIIEEAEESEESEETPKAPKTPKEPEKPPVDWETKAKESQKEAMVLKSQLDKIEEEKTKKVEITEDFLKEKYPDWEYMTLGEQKALKRTEELEQEVVEIKNSANQFNNDRKWQENVETYINEEVPDLFPKIVGREEEFKRFATRPSRKGLPMDDLAKIFLFENPVTEKKRSLFHASGGEAPPAKEGMTPEEAAELMRTRPGEYVRLIRAKKLNIKI